MRDNVVEKRAVVAHQQQRASVTLQGVFEQFERFDVEVVGGFVQYQQIGGLGKQSREQQAIALAAREQFDGRLRALRREQKVIEITHHMLATVGGFHPLGAGADGFHQRAFRIELCAHLVEIGDLQISAQAYRARIRRERAQYQFDQRGFACAIGADESKAVAAHDAQRQIFDQGVGIEAFGDINEFSHQLAGAFAGIQRELHFAQALAPRRAFITQCFQPAHAAFVAGAARLNAFAYPHFLLRPEFVKLAIGDGFIGQLIGLARFVRGEVAGIGAQQPAIEFDDARDDPIQKRAIMGDDNRRLDRAGYQQVFEQRNTGYIEMVGRLIQQQQVGFACERQCEHRSFAFAAGCGGGGPIFIETEAMQKLGEPRFGRPAFAVVVQVFETGAQCKTFAQGGRQW